MSVRSRVARILAVAALLSFSNVAHAAWAPDGTAIAVYNCEELPTSSISDGHGGMYVFWSDNRFCTGARVYVQRLLGSGQTAAGWPAGGLRVSTFEAVQGAAIAVPDGAGGAIVVWQDERTGERAQFAQRIQQDGARAWEAAGVRVAPTSGDQIGVSVLADGAGGAFLAWMDRRRGLDDGPLRHHPLYDIYAQRLDPSGATQWAADGVPVDSSGTDRTPPRLITDGATGAHVTWIPTSAVAHLQHLRVNGSVAFEPNGTLIAGRYWGFQAADGAGGIVSAFQYGPDTQEDLYAQRVDSSGVILWPLDGVVVASAAFGQRPNAIEADGTGGAFIAFYDLRNGNNWDVYVQRIGSDGSAAPGWPANGRVVSDAPRFQIYPTMTGDDAGGVVVTWYDARDSLEGYDIYAQRVDGTGALAAGWPVNGARLCGAVGEQVEPLPVRDGSGGALVAWSDYRIYADVFAQRVSGAGVVGETEPVIGVGDGPALALSLGAAVPNPVLRGAFAVSFTAPGAAPATFSLVDARGRSVLRRVVAPGSSGRITLAAAELVHLASGVYVLHLEQSGHGVSSKVAIMR